MERGKVEEKELFPWADLPTEDGIFPVLAVKASQTLDVVAAGPARGVETHYLDGRSWPCLRRVRPCWRCVKQKSHFKAYLPAYTLARRRVVVELTLNAVRGLGDVLRADIRGVSLRLRRRGEAKTGPVTIEILHDRSRWEWVVDFDPRPSLEAMWRLPPGWDDPPPGFEDGEDGEDPHTIVI